MVRRPQYLDLDPHKKKKVGSGPASSGKRDPHPPVSGSGYATLPKYLTQLRDVSKINNAPRNRRENCRTKILPSDAGRLGSMHS